MNKLLILFIITISLSIQAIAQTVTDYDGNVYNTVTIGTQVWMKENLRVTHYRDGTPVPNVQNDSLWPTLTYGARCYYNNDSASYASVYGAMYNWYTINYTDSIAPPGWRVPGKEDWNILANFLGGTDEAGGKLKEAGFTHWNTPNTGATNQSEFTALPGGIRIYSFSSMGYDGYFWTATSAHFAWEWYWAAQMDYRSTQCILNVAPDIYSGLYIRCIKDTVLSTNEIIIQPKIEINPNPATDKLYIKLPENVSVKMQIYNTLGILMLQEELPDGISIIDISFLPKGLYLINFSATLWSETKKLVKQ